MIAVLLIAIPLLTGLVAFFVKNEKAVRSWALFSSLITVAIAVAGLFLKTEKYVAFHAEWMNGIGSSFSVRLDGLALLLCLLTAVSYPIIFLSTWHSQYRK